jgi:maleamate amidohydrolase
MLRMGGLGVRPEVGQTNNGGPCPGQIIEEREGAPERTAFLVKTSGVTTHFSLSSQDQERTIMSDIDVYRRQRFGQRLGFGESPALAVIDFTRSFADPAVLGGGNIEDAVKNTAVLLQAARERGWPIVFSRHVYAADGSNRGLFNLKAPSNDLLVDGTPGAEIVPELTPLPGEFVLTKQFPSAFVGTILASWLAQRRVDTLVVTGCTTSGCVRATVLDALCAGFRPIVPRDCVGDRAEGPHEANLFDMDQKYADVVSSNEVIGAYS